MWVELRGVTRQRAVLDVAKLLGFLRDDDYSWLLREVGEFADAEEAKSSAMAAGDFVLVEYPRVAHWNKKEIRIDWAKNTALWDFLWELGRHAKARTPVDRFTFGDSADANVVTKRKSRLTGMKAFQTDLAVNIEVVGRGTQQLKLPSEQIRIFERTSGDALPPYAVTCGVYRPVGIRAKTKRVLY